MVTRSTARYFLYCRFPSSTSGAKDVSARVTSPRRTPTTGRTEFSHINSKTGCTTVWDMNVFGCFTNWGGIIFSWCGIAHASQLSVRWRVRDFCDECCTHSLTTSIRNHRLVALASLPHRPTLPSSSMTYLCNCRLLPLTTPIHKKRRSCFAMDQTTSWTTLVQQGRAPAILAASSLTKPCFRYCRLPSPPRNHCRWAGWFNLYTIIERVTLDKVEVGALRTT